MKITEYSKIKQNPDIISYQEGDELYLIHPEKGYVFTLNEVGASIWKNIKKPTLITSIMSYVISEFEVEEKAAMKDVDTFLNVLFIYDLAGFLKIRKT